MDESQSLGAFPLRRLHARLRRHKSGDLLGNERNFLFRVRTGSCYFCAEKRLQQFLRLLQPFLFDFTTFSEGFKII